MQRPHHGLTTRVTEKVAPRFAKVKQRGFDGVKLLFSTDEPVSVTTANNMLDTMDLDIRT